MTDKQKKDLEEVVSKYLNDNEIEGSPLVWVTSSQLCGNSTRGKRAQCGILDDYREPQEEDIVIISFPKEEEK